MSKEALRDAFMMGWHYSAIHRNKSKTLAENHFEAWYRQSVNTGLRGKADEPTIWIDEASSLVGMDFATPGIPVKNFGIQGDLAAIDFAEVERRVLADQQAIGRALRDYKPVPLGFDLGAEDRPPPPYTSEETPETNAARLKRRFMEIKERNATRGKRKGKRK